MNEFQLEFASEDRAIRAVNGICRYCNCPRPPGYSVTCGNSHCQQRAYEDSKAISRKHRRRAR